MTWKILCFPETLFKLYTTQGLVSGVRAAQVLIIHKRKGHWGYKLIN